MLRLAASSYDDSTICRFALAAYNVEEFAIAYAGGCVVHEEEDGSWKRFSLGSLHTDTISSREGGRGV
jgi:hypothetical protein